MIWILLVVDLLSSVFGTFVVNVTQSSYQAEENHNITLEWTFTNKPHMSVTSIKILCRLITDHRVSTVFHLHDGVDVSESQDEQFSGRVQFDKDVLREGRIRLQLSRLRTEDSGLYLCKVKTDCGFSSSRCQLNITAAKDCPEPEKDPELNTAIWAIGLFCGLGLTAAAVMVVCRFLLFHFLPRIQDFYSESINGFEETCSSADGSEETV